MRDNSVPRSLRDLDFNKIFILNKIFYQVSWDFLLLCYRFLLQYSCLSGVLNVFPIFPSWFQISLLQRNWYSVRSPSGVKGVRDSSYCKFLFWTLQYIRLGCNTLDSFDFRSLWLLEQTPLLGNPGSTKTSTWSETPSVKGTWGNEGITQTRQEGEWGLIRTETEKSENFIEISIVPY